MCSLQRRVAMLILAASAMAVLALGAAPGWAKPRPVSHKLLNLAGTWSGTYSGGYSGTFTLIWKQTGSRLTGTITLSSPRGTFSVGGSITGSAINFGAVGAGATYTGSASGKSMSGSYKALPKGGSWNATKVS